MSYTEVNILVPENKYNIKCPYSMTAEGYCVHNTYNDAPARNEANYMKNNNNKVSFHHVVDDKEVVHCIPENRNAWHAGDGNGSGNRKYISVEICYSKSGGAKFTAAEENAAQFIAKGLMARGWGIERVKKHQDFSGKYCPHRTLDLGWERFLNLIRGYLGQATIPTPPSKPSKPPVTKLAVDGSWGIATTKATQKMFGTTQDGIVSGQPLGNKKYLANAYTGSWKFVSNYKNKGGSAMVRALQKFIGATADGWFGKGSVMALQRFLNGKGYNLKVDGSMGKATVMAWQQYINSRL